MRLLVTGASGYIGTHLAAAACAAGHTVVAATRRRMPGFEWFPFELAGSLQAPLPDDVEAVVHLAANTEGPDGIQGEIELAAARQLLSAARAGGARFVFVSSQTARQDAPTPYGLTKWTIEQLVLREGGVVVRPGQVYGGTPRALFGTLVGVVKRLPLLPAFLPAPRIQPVHVDDLAAALLALAVAPGAAGRVFHIAEPQPVSFTRFLRTIARRLGVVRMFVPVPGVLVVIACRLAGGRIAVLERLASLFALPTMDTAPDLRELGLELRPLAAGMAGSSRSLLLRESRTLLRYVLGQEPGAALVRRQARAVERLRRGKPLLLPALAHACPACLAWLEDRSGRSEFQWRLDAATAIAEASPQGARRFLASAGPVAAIIGIAGAVAAEAFWRSTGVVMRPLLRKE